MYKNELLGFLKKIDPDSSLEINDIPDNLVADTYSYVLQIVQNVILENIK